MGDSADARLGWHCTITNRGEDNACGYHEPGDNPDDIDYYFCGFGPSSEAAECRWPVSVPPSAPLGTVVHDSYALYLRGYPRSGYPIARTTAHLTIGTTGTHPSASATAPHPSQTAGGGLPVTGTSLPLVGGLAAVLLGGGAGLVLLARRRTRPVHQ